MRMMPSRFNAPQKPVVVKKQRAQLLHFSPPVSGLAEVARTAQADPKYAGILVNMYVDDDRLTCRAGFQKIASIPPATAIEHLIPLYSSPDRLMAASNLSLYDAITGSLLQGGFTSNNWFWTNHSDLGAAERVVMVNGNDGVWSWDGGAVANSAQITITRLGKATSPATDAIVTVAAADIAKFSNYQQIIISGADPAHSAANGSQVIYNVNSTTNTFSLLAIDSSGWGGDQTTGTIKAVIQGSFIQEPVRPPKGNTWLSINDLSIVIAHQNRLFFTDESNLAVYYLPLQQRYGTLSILPMNAIFRKGGFISAMASWTTSVGSSMNDNLVVFTSNGEAAVWSGVDPDTDFSLVGVFRFEPPMSKWSVVNYGGELYVLQSTGMTPASTVIRSGREGAEAADKTLVTRFIREASSYRSNPGWELTFNPATGRAMVNIPHGGGVYIQLVRNMAKPAWAEWRDIPSRCWAWIAPYNYFADDNGNVYRQDTTLQSDARLVNGVWTTQPIRIDVQVAWNQFKSPAIKQFKMILPYIITDGYPASAVDVKVDYDTSAPVNIPEISLPGLNQATWDVSPWDSTPWAAGPRTWSNWTGVASMGRVGAIRMTAAVYNCSYSITGWDVLYESGSVFG